MGINDEKTQRSFCRFRRRLIEIDLHNRVSSKFEFRRDIRVRKHAEFAGYVRLSSLSIFLEFDCIHKPRAISVIYTP